MDLRRSSLIVKYSSLSFLTKSSRKYSSSSSPAPCDDDDSDFPEETKDHRLHISYNYYRSLSLSIC